MAHPHVIHLPDPVLNDIRQLQMDNMWMRHEIEELREKLNEKQNRIE